MIGRKSQKIKYIDVATPENPLILESCKAGNENAKLINVTLAYEQFGEFNSEKSNVILICHALSGDSHVGTYPDEPDLPGWWQNYVGPGLVFDTNKYAIICSNVLGGCMGSTGPTSINPQTGKRYNLGFPIITIKDMVEAQKRLIDALGIKKLHAVVGGSMGGMQALQWSISYPDRVKLVMPIATTARLSPQAIAFNEVGRRAITNDPKWNRGNYSDTDGPNNGLALARMIGHITYLSDESMREKFGRNLQERESYCYDFTTEFCVESYLNYQGTKFTARFDANTYLYITKALDYFDLERAYGSLKDAFSNVTAKFLVMAFKSDWLYPIYQSKEIVKALQQAGKCVSYCEIDTNYGHDAFLLEYDKMAPMMINFLNN
jgi:homoserine O-acetyltransferase